MSSTTPLVRCKNCGAQLAENPSAPVEERQPCPECGSMSRQVGITLTDTAVTIHESLAVKAKSPGEREPFLESKQGDSYSTKWGRFMTLLQVVDRRNNRYRKLVTDPETGEILRDVDEPLTDHRGYGSAKKAS